MSRWNTRERNDHRTLSLGRAVSNITLNLTEDALQALETRPIQRDRMLAIPAQAVPPSESAQLHSGALRRVVYECYFKHML
jgi:hypothetical protein